MSAPLRIGTRRSALAVAQSEWVAARLRTRWNVEVELVPIVTGGDRLQTQPNAPVPGRGLFVRELEEALRGGAVDLCVHSAKDVPPRLPAGLELVAFPPRADARDALVGDGRGLAQLPRGARVGTGSARRAVQLRRARPDLQVAPIRGNVDTRLGRVGPGGLDAVVLAACGLDRLGLADGRVRVLSCQEMVPAAGQGALAVEAAQGGPHGFRLRALDDPATRLAVLAERAVLAALDAGCSAPVGAHAALGSGGLRLIAAAWGIRSGAEARVEVVDALAGGALPDADALAGAAARLAGRAVDGLLARGARALLAEAEEDRA